MREIDQELASHVCAIRYLGSHSHVGGTIVTEKFRGMGCYKQDSRDAVEVCDQNYTIGSDIPPALIHAAEKEGFKKAWSTYAVSLNIEKIAENLATMTYPKDLHVKSLYDVQLEKLLEYDRSVFGTDREVLNLCIALICTVPSASYFYNIGGTYIHVDVVHSQDFAYYPLQGNHPSSQ